MRRKRKLTYCEQCGGLELSGTDGFLVFHQLTFCCTGCRDDYRAEQDARREARHAAETLATVAEVMRRDKAAARKPAQKRARAA
ncbi:MAG: hypothetical protein JO000_00560 [Alphaproteobacteria bacterium]|nr:hypothetical protein [Alphaproteobacteria bacterium]